VTAQGFTVSSATNENNHRVVSVTVAGSRPACWAASSATWHTYRKFSGAAQHWAISLPSRRPPTSPSGQRSKHCPAQQAFTRGLLAQYLFCTCCSPHRVCLHMVSASVVLPTTSQIWPQPRTALHEDILLRHHVHSGSR